MSRLLALAIGVVLAAPACGPREVMRVGSDRAVPASETTGGSSGPAPSGPVRATAAGSSTAPADPTVDPVDPATGEVLERFEGDPSEDDLDDGSDDDD